MKTRIILLALIIGIFAPSPGLSQSVTTVETYGPVHATQAYNGLGIIVTPTNSWEYSAAQAAHITWGRFDCSWDQTEIQNMPSNTSGGYKLPSSCAAGLDSGKTYGVHPFVDALYGPPYSPIIVGTTASAVPIGATTLSINVTSGSLSQIVLGSTFLGISSGWLSPKFSYPGVLITSVSGSTLTLASAASTALPQGAAVTLNIELYPPVIIPPSGNFLNNSSVQAYGKYAAFLAQQVASSGNTGVVSIWNEPTWHWDKWDHGVALYDTPPANNDISDTLGVELPLYVSTLQPVAGVPFDSSYTEISMWPGSLFYPSTYAHVNLTALQASFGSESFHTYGNNPEDYIWDQACIAANATPQLVSTILSGTCTPTGLWTGATISAAVAAQSYPGTNGGIRHNVSETGICRSCTGATETQVARFDLREFLAFQGLGVSPVSFYRMSGEADWEWMSSAQSPFPVYTAFQNLMKDLGTIAQPPLVACPPCSTPTVSSYKGYYPLATAIFLGARSGDQANSILYYTWQRSYGANGKNWASVASPVAVPVTVTVPSGMMVTSVKDIVTSAAVTFSFSGGELTYDVADNPVEVLMTPPAATSTSQTITFPGIASRTYGSAPFTVAATSSLGSSYPVTITVQSGPAAISGGTVTVTGVGTVVLLAAQAGNGQVAAASATQSFQVTPAVLTLSANDATRAYGAANPAFAGTVTGAVNGDTFSETFTTTATSTSNAGTYAIVPGVSGTDLSDYGQIVVDGTLTVTAAPGAPTAAATTAVLSAPSSAIAGTGVTVTATVTSASVTPTGMVTFYNGSSPLGTATLNGGGVATLSTTTLPVGTDSLTAAYAGGATFLASTSAADSIIITAASVTDPGPQPTAALLSAPSSAVAGTGVTLTATVTSASGTPTGAVTFYSGSNSLGTGTLNASGVAKLNTTVLSVGTDTLTAAYPGAASFTASTSPADEITITAVSAPPTTQQPSFTMAATPNELTIEQGQSGNTTLNFTPSGGFTGLIILSCSNMPVNAACTFAQPQISLTGNNQAASIALTIKTTVAQARSNSTPALPQSPLTPALLAAAFWWPGGLTGLAVFVRKRKHLKQRRLCQLCLLILGTLGVAVGLSGCGVSGLAGTQGATAQVTVIATGPSGTSANVQSLVLTLHVTE